MSPKCHGLGYALSIPYEPFLNLFLALNFLAGGGCKDLTHPEVWYTLCRGFAFYRALFHNYMRAPD